MMRLKNVTVTRRMIVLGTNAYFVIAFVFLFLDFKYWGVYSRVGLIKILIEFYNHKLTLLFFVLPFLLTGLTFRLDQLSLFILEMIGNRDYSIRVM